MITWGMVGNSHDASLAVFDDNELYWAALSKDFSDVPHDPDPNWTMLEVARQSFGPPEKVIWYERPFLKTLRQWQAGQGWLYKENNIKKYLSRWGINCEIEYTQHHLSHAAYAYYTQPHDNCAVICLDSIGEYETLTVWHGKNNELKKIHSQRYPHSLGLFYSAMTQRLGLKPQEDEYILMGMAAYGKPNRDIKSELKELMGANLHRGCLSWDSIHYPDDDSEDWKFNIAANVQSLIEDEIYEIFLKTKELVPETDNMCYGGGVALNCVANSMVAEELYPSLWIIPNPGDGGSSLGCAAYVLGEHLNFDNCFLGYDIKGEYPIDKVLKELLEGKIVGVANGRAEFGPRALGNRSLLADPRGDGIKDRVNEIKHRQKFRPFAPSVLEEHAHEIFDMPVKKSQFMQFTAPCKYPERYPAICHVDNTSRVQTVSKLDNPGYYKLIKEFYKKTGCPMVLNTSLNIKGQPIVNSHQDGVEFSKKYKVKVY